MERLIKQNVIRKFYLKNVRKVSIRVQMFLTQHSFQPRRRLGLRNGCRFRLWLVSRLWRWTWSCVLNIVSSLPFSFDLVIKWVYDWVNVTKLSQDKNGKQSKVPLDFQFLKFLFSSWYLLSWGLEDLCTSFRSRRNSFNLADKINTILAENFLLFPVAQLEPVLSRDFLHRDCSYFYVPKQTQY